MALRWTRSACDSIASISLQRSMVSGRCVLSGSGDHGAVQAHAGVGSERGQLARLGVDSLMLYMPTGIGDVLDRVEHGVEFDRQRMDLVAVDRRGERAVQQGDHFALILSPACSFRLTSATSTWACPRCRCAKAVHQAQGGVGAGDDTIGMCHIGGKELIEFSLR
jgi:hypothetical protein